MRPETRDGVRAIETAMDSARCPDAVRWIVRQGFARAASMADALRFEARWYVTGCNPAADEMRRHVASAIREVRLKVKGERFDEFRSWYLDSIRMGRRWGFGTA